MTALLLLASVLGTGNVDMTLTPSTQDVAIGCIAEVELVLSAGAPVGVAAVDAILTWNPAELQLLQAVPSTAGWFVTGFLNDPDNINADLTDGDAIYTVLASPAAPPMLPPDVLVATFHFEVLADGAVSLPATLGAFGVTKVVGLTPGSIITGTLSAPASVSSANSASAQVVRAGTPPNPLAFQPGVTTGPILGDVWDPVINHSTFVPAATLDLVVVTLQPTNISFPPNGTLLCLPPLLVNLIVSAPGVPFAIPIPSNCNFSGIPLCTQGVSLDAAGDFFFTNALDITLGTI